MWTTPVSIALALVLFGAAQDADTAAGVPLPRHEQHWNAYLVASEDHPDLGRPAPSRRAALEAYLEATRELPEKALRGERASGRVPFAIARLARELQLEHEQVAALRLLREGRMQCGEDVQPSRLASIVAEEARLLDTLGLADQAAPLHAEAMRLAARGLAEEERPNFGAFVIAHLEAIRHRYRCYDFEGVLRELEAFESSAAWRRIQSERPAFTTRSLGERLLLRGCAQAMIPELEDDARDTLWQLIVLEDARIHDRESACSALIQMEHREGVPEAAQDAFRVLTELQAASDGAEQTLSQKLLVASTRARTCSAEERPEALVDLREAYDRFLEERRSNPVRGGTAVSRFLEYRLSAELLLAAREGLEQVRFLLESQSVGRLWDALGRPTPGVEAALEAVTGPATGCLIYLDGGIEAHWVSIAPDRSVERHAVPRVLHWGRRARAHREELGVDPRELTPGQRKRRARALAAHGEALAKTLFPPALRGRLAGWKRIHVIGREEMGGLMLEALPLDGGPLGCTHALIETPSLPVAVALRARQEVSSARRSVRIVADPSLEPALVERGLSSDWNLTAPLLRKSLAWEAGRPLTLELQKAARASSVGRRGEQLLHLIVHGLQDPYEGRGTLLALTPDKGHPRGLLDHESVRDLRCAPTVLLSVCQAGDAPSRNGDAGSNDLGGAFLEAGASLVLLAPSEIRLDATLQFARHFYAAWNAGVEASEALRRARASLASDGSSPYADPYHWGTMRAFGLAALPAKKSREQDQKQEQKQKQKR